MDKVIGLVALLLVVTTTPAAQDKKSASTRAINERTLAQHDEKAQNALLSLKKLEATVESGVARSDYTRALAEANFPLKLFVESDDSTRLPNLTLELQSAMKWYKAAAALWEAKISTDYPLGFCEAWKDPRLTEDNLTEMKYLISSLCDAYPELVTVEQKMGHYKPNKDDDYHEQTILEDRRVIRYERAMQKAWQLAGENLTQAKPYMK